MRYISMKNWWSNTRKKQDKVHIRRPQNLKQITPKSFHIMYLNVVSTQKGFHFGWNLKKKHTITPLSTTNLKSEWFCTFFLEIWAKMKNFSEIKPPLVESKQIDVDFSEYINFIFCEYICLWKYACSFRINFNPLYQACCEGIIGENASK